MCPLYGTSNQLLQLKTDGSAVFNLKEKGTWQLDSGPYSQDVVLLVKRADNSQFRLFYKPDQNENVRFMVYGGDN